MKKVFKFLFPYIYKDIKIIVWYRIGHFFYKYNFKRLSFLCESFILSKYGCAISCQAKIGRNISFPHLIGIVIGGGCEIEDNVRIYQNVTLGRKKSEIAEYPFVGRDSIVYSNSVILGNVRLANGTVVGANTVLAYDTVENGVYVGNPCKKISSK